jgi:hypothetical protein
MLSYSWPASPDWKSARPQPWMSSVSPLNSCAGSGRAPHEAHAAGGVARGVQHAQGLGAEAERVAVLQLHGSRAHVAAGRRGHARAVARPVWRRW